MKRAFLYLFLIVPFFAVCQQNGEEAEVRIKFVDQYPDCSDSLSVNYCKRNHRLMVVDMITLADPLHEIIETDSLLKIVWHNRDYITGTCEICKCEAFQPMREFPDTLTIIKSEYLSN